MTKNLRTTLPAWSVFTTTLAAGAWWAAGTASGQGETVQAAQTVNVVAPAAMEPTSARLAKLKLPAGFQIRKFAQMDNPRIIAVAGDGTVYVSQRESGTLVMLRDLNKDGRADVQKVVATRKGLHGLAIRGNTLLFITVKEIYAATIKKDGTLSTPRLLIKDLPDAGQHPNRTIGYGPDGMLYISVGSTCNACREPNAENATMLRAKPDGKNRAIFASGLRNTIGFGWHPTSKRLYGFDHGIDWLGDDSQREELNELRQGKRYGWPYIYEDGKVNPHPAPPRAYTPEDWAKMSQTPLLTYRAHSAPMQMAFYTGSQFPAEYRNDAFIAMRGSWNRKPPSGYEVVRVRFDQAGKPVSIMPFLTGFLVNEGTPDEPAFKQLGRLVGMAMAKDGSLLLGDDTNNTIYRISYGAKNAGRATTTAMDAGKITMDLPETAKAPASIQVRANFRPNSMLDVRHTAYDKNLQPALYWSGIPARAKSLVVMMEDPDALSPKPFTHWLVANIPATAKQLPGSIPAYKTGAWQFGAAGAGNGGKVGYFGSKPPADGVTHHYHFQVFALDRKLDLPSGYNRQALLDKMRGHVLAKGQIIGTYKRDAY